MVACAVDDILNQAVREKSALRVTAIDGMPCSHNARALQVSDKAGAEGLWVHLPDTDEATIGRFAKSLPLLAFSLAAGKTRFGFVGKVLARDPRFWFND